VGVDAEVSNRGTAEEEDSPATVDAVTASPIVTDGRLRDPSYCQCNERRNDSADLVTLILLSRPRPPGPAVRPCQRGPTQLSRSCTSTSPFTDPIHGLVLSSERDVDDYADWDGRDVRPSFRVGSGFMCRSG